MAQRTTSRSVGRPREFDEAAALEAARLAAPDRDHVYVQADATQPEQLEAALARIRAECGDIEVLIYNARGGYQLRDSADAVPDELRIRLEDEVDTLLAELLERDAAQTS